MNRKLKWFTLMLAVCCLLQCNSTVSYANWMKGATVCTAEEGALAKLYERPREKSEVLGLYYTGTSLNVLREREDGWVEVYVCASPDQKQGYMMKADLSIEHEKGDVSKFPVAVIQSQDGTHVSLRKRPKVTSSSKGEYLPGTVVTIVGEINDWYFVGIGFPMGYIQKSNCELTGELVDEVGRLPVIGTGILNGADDPVVFYAYPSPESHATVSGTYEEFVALDALKEQVLAVLDGWIQVDNRRGSIDFIKDYTITLEGKLVR